MSQIKDDCEFRFDGIKMPIILTFYVILIILFSHQYRLIATIIMVCFMLIVMLSKRYCLQAYWKYEFYGYFMYMYVGMLVVSWIKFDNIVFAYLLNALSPVVLLCLARSIPTSFVMKFMPSQLIPFF
jgi:hypothetical protein